MTGSTALPVLSMEDRLGNYMYVDVGGGSTEINLLTNGELVWSVSYNIGTCLLYTSMENFGTEVIYVCGNHDYFLDSLVPMTFYNVKIVKEYILETHGKRCLLYTSRCV